MTTRLPPSSEETFEPGRRDKLLGRIAVLGTLVALTSWVVFMAPEWWRNPDLSHGLATPLLSLLALQEARTRGSARYLPGNATTGGFTLFLLIASLSILTFSGLVAAALAWSNALVSFLLATALTTLMGAGLTVAAQTSLRWIPFNWPAVVACLVWWMSAPIPPGTYSRLSIALQMGVTRTVIASLHLLGIPAQHVGNVIQLSATRVGVEDACSGIRSLVSCIVAALFISATLVHRPWARVVLLILAAPVAIAMNFVRSLVLTLLAARGYAIDGALHDVSGYAVLVVTASILGAFALLTGKSKSPPPRTLAAPAGVRPTGLLRAYTSFVGAAVAIVAGFAFATRPAPQTTARIPDLDGLLPAEVSGWRVETSTDLYRFSSTLRTKHLAQRTYLKDTPTGPLQVTVYLAYWLPGQAPVSLVSSHTPDACWPGAGWMASPELAQHALLTQPRLVPPAQYRRFDQGELSQHVWFWHLYRGTLVTDVDPFSPFKMVEVVLRYGIRSQGEQAFVRISSNRSWTFLETEPLVAELLTELRALGL
jgi:exosortase